MHTKFHLKMLKTDKVIEVFSYVKSLIFFLVISIFSPHSDDFYKFFTFSLSMVTFEANFLNSHSAQEKKKQTCEKSSKSEKTREITNKKGFFITFHKP